MTDNSPHYWPVSGHIGTDDSDTVPEIIDRLRNYLAEQNYVAATSVEAVAESDGEPLEAIELSLFCDAQGRLLHADPAAPDGLRPGAQIGELAETLAAVLPDGAHIELDSPFESEELADEDLPRLACAVFSHRPLIDGALLARSLKTPRLEGGQYDGWTAFRTDVASHETVTAGQQLALAGELPSVSIEFYATGPDPAPSLLDYADNHATITVQTGAVSYHFLFLDEFDPAGFMRPVISAAHTDPEPLQALLHQAASPQLGPDSVLSSIIAELTERGDARFNAEALQAAFTAGPGSTVDRLLSFLIDGFGIPAELVHPALTGQELPEQKIFTAEGTVRQLLTGLVDDGAASFMPANEDSALTKALQRLDRLPTRRPALAYAFSAAEAVAGTGLIALGRGTGKKTGRLASTAAKLTGGVLIVDALADIALTTARMIRRNN